MLIRVYAGRTGKYPLGKTLQDLVSSFKQSSIYSNELNEALIDGWGNMLYFESSEDAMRYVLASPGPNKNFEVNPQKYLWGIPEEFHFKISSKNDDWIIANECDVRVPEGITINCDPIAKTVITMKNFRDTLLLYWDRNSRYPKHLESFQKERNSVMDGRTYGLSFVDGWGHKMVYTVTNSGEDYLLASPGHDGIFQANLKDILNGGKQKPIRLTYNSNSDIVIIDGQYSIWPSYSNLPDRGYP